MDQIKAPCSWCTRETNHNVLYSTEQRDDFYEHALIECAGCGNISMRRMGPAWGAKRTVDYYPSPVSRRQPEWMTSLWVTHPAQKQLDELFREIYAAVAGGQLRLAAMGIRSLLEQIMIAKVGDQSSFARNLDEFCQKGFIPSVQREAMSAILDAGHAVTHRSFNPKQEELNTALDIAEGVFAAIYIHTAAATEIADRVPPRPPRSR
jgi:hypothetical protein